MWITTVAMDQSSVINLLSVKLYLVLNFTCKLMVQFRGRFTVWTETIKSFERHYKSLCFSTTESTMMPLKEKQPLNKLPVSSSQEHVPPWWFSQIL